MAGPISSLENPFLFALGAWTQTRRWGGRKSSGPIHLEEANAGGSVKPSQVVPSPTGVTPKLLQLQRSSPMSADVASISKENGQASPRRSFDSSSGSIRSDSSSIHPLKYTWVVLLSRKR